MKIKRNLIQNWLLCAALSTFTTFYVAQPSTIFAQGTAFTYQGRLNDTGQPANGSYDLTFGLFNTSSGGGQVGNTLTNTTTTVSNGLFTVTLDFGTGVFTGPNRWLGITARTNGAASFTTLAPRQPLLPMPYAIMANTASNLMGTLPAAQLSGGTANINISGNAATATWANNITGPLYGDVTGTQGATVVSTVGGQTAANIASGVSAANAATSANTASAIVRRDASGNFSAGSVTLGGVLNLPVTTASAGIIYSAGSRLLHAYGAGNSFVGLNAGNLTMSGADNTANGSQALLNNTSGSNNIAVGYQAGYWITTGSSNIDIGNQGTAIDNNIIRIGSGQSQTFIAGVINGNGAGLGGLNASALFSIGNTNGGVGNFFVGYDAGNSTTSGSDNTAYGDFAFFSNTSGSYNTANGYEALLENTSGSLNTANGCYALLYNTSGSGNTAIGNAALYSNTSGSDNTAIGIGALNSSTNGFGNIAVGVDALQLSGNGSGNTAVGDGALQVNLTGIENTAIGDQALNNANGNTNIALGYNAGYMIRTGGNNIDIGNQGTATDTNIIRIGSGQNQMFLAGVINGNGGGLTNLIGISAAQLTSIGNTNGGGGNFFVGPSGNSTTSGWNNTANGLQALFFNREGSDNTANGGVALCLNTSGSYNTADGFMALYNNTSGSTNIALGQFAGYNIYTGNNNIDIGNPGVTSDNNTIRIGSTQTDAYIAGAIHGNGSGLTSLNASQLTSIGNTNGGGGNFFVGPSGNSTMSGWNNTANGLQALFFNREGSDNTANGGVALCLNTSGSYNTADGFMALYNNTSGSTNIALGQFAGYNIYTGNNNIDIGNPGVTSDNNTIRIGSSQTATFIAGISGTTAASGVAVYVNSSGKLGTLTSSRHFKQDIQTMGQSSDILYALKPVAFKYKPGIDPQGIPQFGLVAEDVEEVAPDLVAHDDKGQPYTVRYEAVNAMLLNEFLKEHNKVEAQNTEIQILEKKLDELQAVVKQLAAQK